MAFPQERGGMDMLTVEVKKTLVRWPTDFALLMIKHYQDFEVPVMVHMVCSTTGSDATYDSVARYAARAESRIHVCCHEQ
jgi:hypothetical protein